MKELSLYILDITENSTRAGAKNISLEITEEGSRFSFSVSDDGCGMSEETVKKLSDPFYTTRTTRKVGLGIPFLRLAAEQTGGHIEISSRSAEQFPDTHGTKTSAFFDSSHIDFVPLGDIISTVVTLIQGNPDTDFVFTHTKDGKLVSLDTKELRAVLEGVPLDSFPVLEWIRESLSEQYSQM
ncbi:MAG: ATP-binding protein [Clostridiales bacterium]|nr:ATP-binding protein [Clostridiales bacterium]